MVLPSGRNGLSRSFVASNQRERIMKAIASAVSEVGYPNTTIEQIISRAGVSRRTFYDRFPDGKEQAYLEAYDEIAERLFQRVAGAYLGAENGWGQLRDCLAAFLEFVASEPEFAHMCFVDVLAAGPEALDRRDAQMRAFAGLFDRAAVSMNQKPLPPLGAEGLVGGVYELIYKRVLRGETEQLPSMLPALYYFCLVPYLGRNASHERYAEYIAHLEAAERDIPADRQLEQDVEQ